MIFERRAESGRRLPARIVAATHNAGKLREIRELLVPYRVVAVGAAELNLAEPDETDADVQRQRRSQGSGGGGGIRRAGARR